MMEKGTSSDTGESAESLRSDDSLRFLAPQLGDCEEVEFYSKGGYHPTHIGDLFDNDRYHVVHKLGSGGFSTVWLARDSLLSRWVALKIVMADHSQAVKEKALMCQQTLSGLDDSRFTISTQIFHIDGPNGRHLCLVLPFLGPSTYKMSQFLQSRIHPWLARSVIAQTASAVADLHSHGLCHGGEYLFLQSQTFSYRTLDLTPMNIVFRIRNLDHLDQQGIYNLLGPPKTAPLETSSGENHGSEAPRYIVEHLDFMYCKKDILCDEISLIDFDQSFLTASPPKKVLGTPAGFLAPEVAVGRPAGPASDVWALGSSLLQIRSGSSPFSILGIESPYMLMAFLIQSLGDMPHAWGDPFFDNEGRPTEDKEKGMPLTELPEDRVGLKEWIDKIYDRPPNFRNFQSTPATAISDDTAPFPKCFDNKFWKPAALKIDDIWLTGYCDEVDKIIETFPKITQQEAELLYDMMSKIFVYEPESRLTISEMLDHPWFKMEFGNKEAEADMTTQSHE
jgi:serine/threonine protein kinase